MPKNSWDDVLRVQTEWSFFMGLKKPYLQFFCKQAARMVCLIDFGPHKKQKRYSDRMKALLQTKYKLLNKQILC